MLLSDEDKDLIPFIRPDAGKYLRIGKNNLGIPAGTHLHCIVAERKFKGTYPAVGLVVDHINNDPLDNRRENLQVVSQRVNSTKNKAAGSKYHRISYDSSRSRWRVAFIVEKRGRTEKFSSHLTETDAAYWADLWAIRLLDENVLLNFPEKLEEYLETAKTLQSTRLPKRKDLLPFFQ